MEECLGRGILKLPRDGIWGADIEIPGLIVNRLESGSIVGVDSEAGIIGIDGRDAAVKLNGHDYQILLDESEDFT